MSAHYEVIVIGGGIWGFSTAWHLVQRGVSRICVVEQDTEPARETTPRASGLIGQIRTSRVMCEAISYGLNLLSTFKDETGHDPGLHRTGSLQVAMTERRMESFRVQVAQAQANGVAAEFVSHSEMERLAPAMDVSTLKGGYFVPGDGYLDPRRCALAFAGAAVDRDVDVRYSTRVTGLLRTGNRIEGVATEAGEIRADQVVVTAGPWTRQLTRTLGVDLPVQTIRHQRGLTAAIPGIPDHHPVVRVNDLSCYIRPEQGGYLYGSFESTPTCIDLEVQPRGFRTADVAIPYEVMADARRRLSQVFPILSSLEIQKYDQGITTFAPDGRYVIGPVPGAEGVHAATGCAALGIAGSPAIGSWLAESVVTGRPTAALSEFDPERFGSRAEDRSWVSEAAARFYANYYNLTPGEAD